MDDGIEVRTARPDEASALARLQRRSRTTAMPWLADLHDEQDATRWMTAVMLPVQRVRVAAPPGEEPYGFSAVHAGWLTQLYVDPGHQGSGIGRALLDDATAGTDGLRLYVFTRNSRARRFYEAAGFVLVGQSDGRDNEEREPDCTYAWEPPVRTSSTPG